MTFMTIKNPFPIVHDGQEYHGGIFGGVAPHGLSIASAANQLRVAYEHKQSSAQKQRYGEHHGDMALVLSHVCVSWHVCRDCACCESWVQQRLLPRLASCLYMYMSKTEVSCC